MKAVRCTRLRPKRHTARRSTRRSARHSTHAHTHPTRLVRPTPPRTTHAGPRRANLRTVKKKETEDVTANTVDAFLNKDAAGTIGTTAVANQTEDNDVNITLNPVQVAQLQAQKDAEVRKVKADKAAKAKASQAAQKAKAGGGAEGSEMAAKKKGLQGLGIDIAPEVPTQQPANEQFGLAEIDAQIRK
jgi:hypothetical protein